MTPKQKAQDLINKFLTEVKAADRYDYNLEDQNLFIARQCAKIVVDEILTLGWNLPHYENMTGEEYWKLVAIEQINLTKTTP